MPVYQSPSHQNIKQCIVFDIYLPINTVQHFACFFAFSAVGRTLTLQSRHLFAKIIFATTEQTEFYIF